ncbi:MAG: hypothetical protein ACO4AY_08935, partial [Ilumatobacteraceae bacterium]
MAVIASRVFHVGDSPALGAGPSPSARPVAADGGLVDTEGSTAPATVVEGPGASPPASAGDVTGELTGDVTVDVTV